MTTLLTISGLAGAGTSTLAKTVAARLGLERVDGGSVFRLMAAERGLDVYQFSAQAESDPQFDLELDQRLAARARQGDVVLESRLAGWIAVHEQLEGLRVWVACDEMERARRVAQRDGIDVEAALAANRGRQESEARRYRDFYGIDFGDLSVYSLIVDSGTSDPDTLAERVLDGAQNS